MSTEQDMLALVIYSNLQEVQANLNAIDQELVPSPMIPSLTAAKNQLGDCLANVGSHLKAMGQEAGAITPTFGASEKPEKKPYTQSTLFNARRSGFWRGWTFGIACGILASIVGQFFAYEMF